MKANNTTTVAAAAATVLYKIASLGVIPFEFPQRLYITKTKPRCR